MITRIMTQAETPQRVSRSRWESVTTKLSLCWQRVFGNTRVYVDRESSIEEDGRLFTQLFNAVPGIEGPMNTVLLNSEFERDL